MTRLPTSRGQRALRSAAQRNSSLISALVYGLSAVIGVAALLYPFLAAAIRPISGQPASLNGPGLMLVLLGVCFAGLLLEVQGQAVSAKLIALLGVLVAINSVLRFVEVGIPGPGGFSPVFVLIILTGYVFGGRFGFLMGALTMLVSGVFTGGVGPWLPAQMFAAGWVGLSAPLARPLVRLAGGQAGIAARGRRAGRVRGRLGVALRRDHEPVVLAVPGRPGGSVLAGRHHPRRDAWGATWPTTWRPR